MHEFTNVNLNTSDEEIPEYVDDPYDLPNNADEWIDSISSTRKNDKMTAIQTPRKIKKLNKKLMTSKLNAIGKQLT